jgi:hypothetical protein
MSHYTQVTTEFDAANKESLIDAIKEVWPEATILENAKVRGYRGTTQQNADIVVRFRNETSESQGNYDIGFVERDGQMHMVADFYGLHYEELRDKTTGRTGSAVVTGMLKPAYTTKVVEKQIRNSSALRGYRNVSKREDYITRKNADGKEVRYKRLLFQEGGYV